ncbi:putative Retrovirus-related Pol polyprotein from transposon TNT 1-94 [Cocos nucifera]|nr:putative Retrovirus-related Pol polyprotein from transposon TNT 1-94 [Cocos nucifera]
MNRFPHNMLNGGILEEVWSKKKVELGHLKVFGCIAYAHMEATERSKLDSKSQKMIFIGYP